MSMKNEIREIAIGAKEAGRLLSSLSADIKNRALRKMAKALIKAKASIKKANERDVFKAERHRLSADFIDRLRINEKRLKAMADSINEVAKLDDPVGRIDEMSKRPNGLLIGKMRVPLGVLSVIYESRPNVTCDCMALALKSGNSLILRGGSEAINSNIAIFDALNREAIKAKIPENAFNIIRTQKRRAVDILLGLVGLIDVIIPRGGESLIREIARKSRIPVIKHYKGVCHVYVDGYADLNMAESIAYNAKVQRPGVCNAMESLLVHKDVASRFLPSMAAKFENAGVEMRVCPKTRKILRNSNVKMAKEKDWSTEYLDLIVSVKVVDSLKEAISRINKYGTMHSDAIVTDNCRNAVEFVRGVDSSSVYVNASTRFTDGYEFGKGAEIGISTDKLHARGPVGAEELTTYKYVIFGSGQIRK